MYTLFMTKSTPPSPEGHDALEVGIKALRSDISRWIEASRQRDVVITHRGRPVARLVAIGEHPGLERLIERGLVRMPMTQSSHLDVSTLVAARGSVSDLVDEQRR